MLTYILQVTLCWGLFALLYALWLRQETFFRVNRLYLLAAVVLGLFLPLSHQLLPKASAGFAVTLPFVTLGLQKVEENAVHWAGFHYLWWLYGAGVLLTGMRLCWGLSKIARMAFLSQAEYLPNGCILFRTPAARLPFSFFHWLFVPVQFDPQEEESKNMLAHEQAHARDWHSVDVLLMEVLCIVAWFHPLVHWYRRALRTVHEFIADSDAANQTDRRQYGLLLLQQAHPTLTLSLANHFFQSPLKQRLLMLTQSNSSSNRAWKYALALPLVFVLWTCTQSEMKDQLASFAPESTLELSEVEKIPEYPGGSAALSAYLAAAIKYPEAARRAQEEGLAVLQITLDAQGQISKVEPAPLFGSSSAQKGRGANMRSDMVEEAIRVVRQMPSWTPAYKNGQAVACKLTLPIRFKLE